MKSYMFCHDEDNVGIIVGPFEDWSWAWAWVKQHDNDIPENEPDNSPKWTDVDHYCINRETLAGDMKDHHTPIYDTGHHTPGFDPDTVPHTW